MCVCVCVCGGRRLRQWSGTSCALAARGGLACVCAWHARTCHAHNSSRECSLGVPRKVYEGTWYKKAVEDCQEIGIFPSDRVQTEDPAEKIAREKEEKSKMAEILKSCELEYLQRKFERNKITSVDMLDSITRDEFSEMKILIGDRIKLLEAKKAFNLRQAPFPLDFKVRAAPPLAPGPRPPYPCSSASCSGDRVRA